MTGLSDSCRHHGALEEEALAEAVKTDYDGIPTSVLSAEHLSAIALKTGRAKDYARIVMFLKQDAVSMEKLNSILLRHGLIPEWAKFESKYLEEYLWKQSWRSRGGSNWRHSRGL